MSRVDGVRASEVARVAVDLGMEEQTKYHVNWKVEKRHGDPGEWPEDPALWPAPYEIVEGEGNILATQGAADLWDRLTGLGTPSLYDATNGRLCVGDNNGTVGNTPAVAATDTDLTAPTNKLRKVVSGAPTRSGATITFAASFASAEANFAWNEWAVANSAAGNIFNHAKPASSLGTKGSGSTWTFTVQITLA